MNENWYFTAPWDPVPIRRGDALGFRLIADHFADLIAPGLSNGTSDARWIAILSWCLQWSGVAWRKAGGGDLSTRDGQKARYAWLRPLELLWVARTLESGQTTGQLRGKRGVQRWLNLKERKRPANFTMSADQFRRYRQIGTYGVYRVALRSMPGLTTGDGWTLGDEGQKLAKLVNQNLPKSAQLEQEQFKSTRWGSWSGNEARYWVENGWKDWNCKSSRQFLPTPNEAILELLPNEERKILRAAIFDKDSTRLKMAEIVARAENAKTHAEICDVLAKNFPDTLSSLPAFTRFADAAMDAMRAMWIQINQNKDSQTPTIDSIAGSMKSNGLEPLLKAGREWCAWLKSNQQSGFPKGHDVVTALAESLSKAKTPTDQIRALSLHHEEYGGGGAGSAFRMTS
ncbi:conserved hypothetical protein [Thiomonas sp. X19]|uniref:hypothetical protein n=1 Tax=Thiomonas sp. X19 TaxID=1050370 RepID=UPI000B716D10|nr:hypothetical protein [Thiomonas sp. X19]SCC93599.1 conserved hypothetical protein [Thiomonas sp. X19]SCC94712.1 conserved hypothetical protein [Thiomonas sp. X19]